MTRDAELLEAVFVQVVETYPEYLAAQVSRIGSLSMVKKSMHILIRREQEGDQSVTPILDDFEELCRAVSA